MTESDEIISYNISNTDEPNILDATNWHQTKKAYENGIASGHPTILVTNPRRIRKPKRGRPKQYWAKRSIYLRRFCPHRLRPHEVANILDADRFADRTGKALKTFLTIRWALTLLGEINIQSRWQSILNSLRMWATRQGIDLAFIWTHENPPRDEPAFNTHCLLNIPTRLREDFAKWLSNHLAGEPNAVVVEARNPNGRHWQDRAKYICKGTDMATAWRHRLITPKGWDYDQGIILFRRCGLSHNINAAARAAIIESIAA